MMKLYTFKWAKAHTVKKSLNEIYIIYYNPVDSKYKFGYESIYGWTARTNVLQDIRNLS